MTVQNPPIYLQAGSHPAERVRRAHSAIMGHRPGVVGLSDFSVTQNGTPNMSVNVSSGMALVQGTESATQGLYVVESTGTVNLSISASDATNPRIDLVVLQVRDSAYSGSSDDARLFVVTGTPAASPSEPTPPANSLVLARVWVGANVTSITNANITDRRWTPNLYAGNLGGTAAGLGGVITCTSTTRPQSARNGQVIFETDTNEVLVYYATPGVWRKPWSQPWGRVGLLDLNPASGIGTTETTIGQVTVPLVNGRMYNISLTLHVYSSSDPTPINVNATTRIRRSGDNAQIAAGDRWLGSLVNVTQTIHLERHYTADSTGNLTFYVSLLRTYGSSGLLNTVSSVGQWSTMIIEDVGPWTTPV